MDGKIAEITRVTRTRTGHYILAGHAKKKGENVSQRAFLACTDANGAVVWARIASEITMMATVGYLCTLVGSLYQHLLMRSPDPQSMATYIKLLRDGESTANIIRRFLRSSEYCRKLVNDLWISLLKKTPHPSERSFYVNLLNNGATIQDLQCRILISDEYRKRALQRN